MVLAYGTVEAHMPRLAIIVRPDRFVVHVP